MKTVFHAAGSRGSANHGWLKSRHTFSFAGYHDPRRVHFGALRVLNDDQVAAGMGFPTHPHDNMEIISIPLLGDLEHQDSMGNKQVIREGDVQVMSAGTGIYHSEYNKNRDREVHFLQIWVFPDKRGHEPRYDQQHFPLRSLKNEWMQVIHPHDQPEGGGIFIYQKAWFTLGRFEAGIQSEYKFHQPGNGLYVFVLEGSLRAGEQELSRRDGLGIWSTDSVEMVAGAEGFAALLMEVPPSGKEFM